MRVSKFDKFGLSMDNDRAMPRCGSGDFVASSRNSNTQGQPAARSRGTIVFKSRGGQLKTPHAVTSKCYHYRPNPVLRRRRFDADI